MKDGRFNSKRTILFFIMGVLVLIALAVLLIPYSYTLFFDNKDEENTGSSSIDPRYMSEITGIDTPEKMQRQYQHHPDKSYSHSRVSPTLYDTKYL